MKWFLIALLITIFMLRPEYEDFDDRYSGRVLVPPITNRTAMFHDTLIETDTSYDMRHCVTSCQQNPRCNLAVWYPYDRICELYTNPSVKPTDDDTFATIVQNIRSMREPPVGE